MPSTHALLGLSWCLCCMFVGVVGHAPGWVWLVHAGVSLSGCAYRLPERRPRAARLYGALRRTLVALHAQQFAYALAVWLGVPPLARTIGFVCFFFAARAVDSMAVGALAILTWRLAVADRVDLCYAALVFEQCVPFALTMARARGVSWSAMETAWTSACSFAAIVLLVTR